VLLINHCGAKVSNDAQIRNPQYSFRCYKLEFHILEYVVYRDGRRTRTKKSIGKSCDRARFEMSAFEGIPYHALFHISYHLLSSFCFYGAPHVAGFLTRGTSHDPHRFKRTLLSRAF
jgi:hypothetical protein